MLKKLIYSFTPPLILLAIMWLVKLYEIHNGIDLGVYGVLPRHSEGLRGILLSPFLHGSIDHLWSNTLPFVILMAALIFFYEEVWWQSFLMIYLLSGIGLWIGGRENYHIGASGIVYGLTGFLFASGIIRRTVASMSLSMLVIFLYGGTIWGIFPMFKEVSWEAHLFGLLSGCMVAFVFSESGPKKKLYQWEKDEVEELIDGPPAPKGDDGETGSGQLAIADKNITGEATDADSPLGGRGALQKPIINYIYTENKNPLP
jgi:membrane associated rhomboid family serine protease